MVAPGGDRDVPFVTPKNTPPCSATATPKNPPTYRATTGKKCVPYGQVADKPSESLRICRNISLSTNASPRGVFLGHSGRVMNAEDMITWYEIALFVFKRITVVTRE